VIDFTVMTDAQIADIFRNSKTIPCGRFFPEQLNRPLQEPETTKPFPFYRKIAAALLALQAVTVASFAQAKKKQATAAHDKKNKQQDPVRALKGRLMDNFYIPAAGVPLTLTARGYDALTATTDEQGCFIFVLDDTYRPDTVQMAIAVDFEAAHPGIVNEVITLDTTALHTELKVYRYMPEVLPSAEVATYAYSRPTAGISVMTVRYKKPTVWHRFMKPFKKRRK
jgi:hypothetical protein